MVKPQKVPNKWLPASPSTVVAVICVVLILSGAGNSKDCIYNTLDSMPKQTSRAHLSDDLPITAKPTSSPSSSPVPHRRPHLSSLLDLPINPKITNSSDFMNNFFSNYATQKGGWIDVNKLSHAEDVPILREMATGIVGKSTRCTKPKVTMADGLNNKKIPTSDDLPYCMWDNDFLSNDALDNFRWEAKHWGWVSRTFTELGKLQETLDSGHKGKCSWGFLDIGVNVGDWISPLRLLHPSVPIYGVEGSPGTAAIATANLRTSVEHHVQQETPVATSYLLPYSLMAEAQYPTIRSNGGVCFSGIPKIGYAMNIGGRSVTALMDCPVSSAAGATTLNDAMLNAPRDGQCEAHSSDYPLIYIAKIDVEGSEFHALSSIVSWWSQQPPCYVMLEYWWGKTSYIAVAELILDFGYDQFWIDGYPPARPMWDKKSGKTAQYVLGGIKGRGHADIIFGFSDIKGCLSR